MEHLVYRLCIGRGKWGVTSFSLGTQNLELQFNSSRARTGSTAGFHLEVGTQITPSISNFKIELIAIYVFEFCDTTFSF